MVAIAFASGLGLAAPSRTPAGPINTNVALTAPKGGNIFRLQYIYSESGARGNVRHVNTSTVRATYLYGLESNLTLSLSAPYHNRQVDVVVPRFGRIERAHDGIGDLTLLAKYRFWKSDPRPQETLRWAALGGVNLRSGDSDFSSDSYDPIVGTVFTWRRDRGGFDADLVYQFNTGSGEFRHDTLRYDVSYAHRVWPEVYDMENVWEFNVVGELNGRYSADGSHEVFLSPGMQFITERWIVEASIQLPVIQKLNNDGPDTNYRLVLGLRFQW